jgi:excisionase family DNA binding protein
VQPQPAATNGPPGEVLTLSEAATYLRLAEADVLRLVDQQALPARRLRNEWRFLKAAIQDWLRTGTRPKTNKEAWLELAGVWKDDPSLDELRKEIDKFRERLLSEKGS